MEDLHYLHNIFEPDRQSQRWPNLKQEKFSIQTIYILVQDQKLRTQIVAFLRGQACIEFSNIVPLDAPDLDKLQSQSTSPFFVILDDRKDRDDKLLKNIYHHTIQNTERGKPLHIAYMQGASTPNAHSTYLPFLDLELLGGIISNFCKNHQLEDCSFPYPFAGENKQITSIMEDLLGQRLGNIPVYIKGEYGTEKGLLAQLILEQSGKSKDEVIFVNSHSLDERNLNNSIFKHIKNRKAIVLENWEGLGNHLKNKIVKFTKEYQVALPIFTSTQSPQECALDIKNCHLIEIPPLRERKDDLPHIIKKIISKIDSELSHLNTIFTSDAMESIKGYSWPGNFVELEHFVRKSLEGSDLSKERKLIGNEDLPQKILQQQLSSQINAKLPINGIDLKGVMNGVEYSLILQSLIRTNGNKNQSSRLLGLNRTTLIEKMKKFGLDSF